MKEKETEQDMGKIIMDILIELYSDQMGETYIYTPIEKKETNQKKVLEAHSS
ncbi:MAG: hypothetical protein RR869_08775 [Lachnospiraceae bacterium]